MNNKAIGLLLISAVFLKTLAQSNTGEKLKQDIKKNTKTVSQKAGKNVEYVARESGKNIKKISEKTAVGLERTVKKIDADVKKKKSTKKK